MIESVRTAQGEHCSKYGRARLPFSPWDGDRLAFGQTASVGPLNGMCDRVELTDSGRRRVLVHMHGSDTQSVVCMCVLNSATAVYCGSLKV